MVCCWLQPNPNNKDTFEPVSQRFFELAVGLYNISQPLYIWAVDYSFSQDVYRVFIDQ